MTEPYLLTRKAAANALSISIGSLDKLISAGTLATVPMGRRVLIPRTDLEALASTGLAGRIRPE